MIRSRGDSTARESLLTTGTDDLFHGRDSSLAVTLLTQDLRATGTDGLAYELCGRSDKSGQTYEWEAIREDRFHSLRDVPLDFFFVGRTPAIESARPSNEYARHPEVDGQEPGDRERSA